MSVVSTKNIKEYQGVVPQRIIAAVEKAAHKTGVDFSFLMNKASTESSFNPSAKSKTSSATGLFQFIDSTWLTMVKQYGAKYGLGKMAEQIEMRNGKACVDDCAVKDQILSLRKNPEISALMAGEFSADNKEYLERNTDANVGAPELYLAHFLGAQNAAKFINERAENGDAKAASLFPQAARANKGVFYTNGRARTLDEIYNRFANKFDDASETTTTTLAGGANTSPSSTSATTPPQIADLGSIGAPALLSPLSADDATPSRMQIITGQALSSSDDAKTSDIVWNDNAETTRSGFGGRSNAYTRTAVPQRLSPVNIMIMAQMQETLAGVKESNRFNS